MLVSVLAQIYEETEDSFPHISLTSHSISQRQRVPKDMSVYYIYSDVAAYTDHSSSIVPLDWPTTILLMLPSEHFNKLTEL